MDVKFGSLWFVNLWEDWEKFAYQPRPDNNFKKLVQVYLDRSSLDSLWFFNLREDWEKFAYQPRPENNLNLSNLVTIAVGKVRSISNFIKAKCLWRIRPETFLGHTFNEFMMSCNEFYNWSSADDHWSSIYFFVSWIEYSRHNRIEWPDQGRIVI